MGKQLTHIDCFSGPGGICTGFKAANIKTILAIEKVASCIETYSSNHPEVPVYHGDIRFVDFKKIKEMCKKDSVDIVTSGMPCETFSTAGSKSRSSYDHRQELYLEAIKIANHFNAKIILFENVAGFTSKKVSREHGSQKVYEQFVQDLNSHGYKNQKTFILNAKNFGVPQNRERFFHLASKDINLKMLSPEKTLLNIGTSVSDAFAGLATLEANMGENGNFLEENINDYVRLLRDDKFWKTHSKTIPRLVTYHIAPNHRPTTIKRFSLIEQGEGLKDLFVKFDSKKVKKLQDDKIIPKKWYIQRNRRLKSNDISPTVTSHCLDELLHPVLNRSVTVREVARLQSFPDSYDFVGGPLICPHLYETQDKYEQIGDAVPPIVAYEWAIAIKKILLTSKDK